LAEKNSCFCIKQKLTVSYPQKSQKNNMKHFFAPAVLLLLSSAVTAQITLTANTYLQAGQIYVLSTDTAGYSGYDPGEAGPGQSWNFSNFEEHIFDTTQIVHADWTPNGSNFPQANLAMFSAADSTYTYYDVSSSYVYGIGLSSTSVMAGFINSVHYDFPTREFRFPLTYLDTIQTRRSFQIGGSGADFGDPSIDSIRVSFEEEVVKEADAYGSIIIPSGSYNVLRIKESGTSISNFEIKLPFIGWQAVGGDTSDVLSFSFQADGILPPVLTLTMNPEGDNTVTYAQAYKSVSTGIKENANNSVKIYPNPVSDLLTIAKTTNGKAIIQVYDITGKLMETRQLNNVVEQISVAHLSQGIYILNMIDANGSIKTERLIKQ